MDKERQLSAYNNEPFSPVVEYLYQALDVSTENPEATLQGIIATFDTDFFDRDDAVAGREVSEKISASLFSADGKQLFTPTAAEWKAGLVEFGARTFQQLEPTLNGSADLAAAKLGQVIVILMGMTRPNTEVGVTTQAGITKEGMVLGRVAERNRLLMDYVNALETQKTIFEYTLTTAE